jgi:hypothetical protein
MEMAFYGLHIHYRPVTKQKRSLVEIRTRVAYTAGILATNWTMTVNWRNVSFTCRVTVKKVENKIVYYEEIVECRHLIFWSRSQRRVHCHTAKPESNRRVTVDRVPLLRIYRDGGMTWLGLQHQEIFFWYLNPLFTGSCVLLPLMKVTLYLNYPPLF